MYNVKFTEVQFWIFTFHKILKIKSNNHAGGNLTSA